MRNKHSFFGQSDVVKKSYFNNSKHRFLIVDVRTHEEYANEHISRALHIPLDEFRRTRYSAPENTTVIFHCRSGRRTENNKAMLMQWALESGFASTRFMAGGIEEWKGWKFQTASSLENKASREHTIAT
jgi:rhodanese-related sulfurtransferase